MARLHLANAIIQCPIVVSGRSGEAHFTSSAEESAESMKELTPDEPETTLTSRNRLQDLPEWFQEFTENLVEPKSTSPGSDSRDPPEPPRPGPLPAKASKGKTQFDYACSQGSTLSDMQAYESYESSLQTKFTKSRTPPNQVRRNNYSRSQSPSMKKNNRGTIKGMQLLYKIWPLHGFKAARVKREETATMFTKVSRSQNPSF